MSVYGYIRVSTVGQAVEGVSLEAQVERINAWSQYKGVTVDRIFSDAGISGSTTDKRPAFIEMMESLQEGDTVVCFKLDRVSRSARDTADFVSYLNDIDAKVVSLSEDLDTGTSNGRMIIGILANVAEGEIGKISERTKLALSYKRSKGKKSNGTASYGYMFDGDTVLENAHEQAAIARAKALRAVKLPLRKIGEALKDEGYSPRGKSWSASAVNNLLGVKRCKTKKPQKFWKQAA